MNNLAPNILNFITQICSHFEYSPQRKAALKKFQEAKNMKIGLPLSYVETRWSSLGNAMERILLLWDSLSGYFEKLCKLDDDYLGLYNSFKNKQFFIEIVLLSRIIKDTLNALTELQH